MGFIERYNLDDINDTLFVDGVGGGGGTLPGGGNPKLTSGGSTKGNTLPDVNLSDRENPDSNDKKSDTIILSIVSETTEGKSGGTILINGVPLEGQAPKEYAISKLELFTSGRKTITMSKQGYQSNQRYEVSVVPVGDNSKDDITLLQDENDPTNILGLQNLKLEVKYYEGSVEKPFRVLNGSFIPLSFILVKDSKPKGEGKSKLNVTLDGPSTSVIITTDTDNGFLERGTEIFDGKLGSKFFIKTANPKLYRISKIVVTDNNNQTETLTAGQTESLSTEIVLTRELSVEITSHRLVKQKIRKPMIKLVSNISQTYNKNEKTDIPLIVEKNDAVRAISVIIGNEIIEFDNLKSGKYAGINIPYTMVEKIGRYNIKLFPYSISELQKGKKDENVKSYDELPKVSLSDRPQPSPTKTTEVVPPKSSTVSTPNPQESTIRRGPGNIKPNNKGGGPNYRQNLL